MTSGPVLAAQKQSNAPFAESSIGEHWELVRKWPSLRPMHSKIIDNVCVHAFVSFWGEGLLKPSAELQSESKNLYPSMS